MTGRFTRRMVTCVVAAILVLPGGRSQVLAECAFVAEGRVCPAFAGASTDDVEVVAFRSLTGGRQGALVEGALWNPGRDNERQFAGGLHVSLDRGDVSVMRSVTDASGAFMLGWVAPGRYVLRITGAQFRSQQREVVIPAGERCQIIPTIRLQGRQ